MAERKPLSKKTRFEVFKRDGFVCQYCGAHPPSAVLECDHIVPVAEGGKNDIDNLVSACFDCNRGKGATSLTLVPQTLAAKAALVAEREEQLRGYGEVMEARRDRLEAETWRVLEVFYPNAERVSHDEFNSTQRFIDKLGLYAVLEAADIAMGSGAYRTKRFKYFCGVCWNKVRKLEGTDA